MKRMFHNNALDWRMFSMVGAVLLALGTTNIPVAAATDIDGPATVSATTYVQILSTTTVDYEATVTRGTDGINTLPWGTQGYQTVGSSSSYLGKTVTVSQEKLADNGVTWALISLYYPQQLLIIRRQSRAARMRSIQRHGERKGSRHSHRAPFILAKV